MNISSSSSFSDLRKRFLRSSEIEMPFLLYDKSKYSHLWTMTMEDEQQQP